MTNSVTFGKFRKFVYDVLNFESDQLSKNYKWNSSGVKETIDFRHNLHEILMYSTNDVHRRTCLQAFVKYWGGSPVKLDTISNYMDTDSIYRRLNDNTESFIPTATKALSLWDPKSKFIYDSRVAIALNFLWKLCPETKTERCPYPILKPRPRKGSNGWIELFHGLEYNCVGDADTGKYLGFYDLYLQLILELAECHEESDPEKIEMSLFVLGGKLFKVSAKQFDELKKLLYSDSDRKNKISELKTILYADKKVEMNKTIY